MQSDGAFVGRDELFKGRHFGRDVVVLRGRSYLFFKLSYRDLVEMMAERGLAIVHASIIRWVHYYAPVFRRRWNRFVRPVGTSWRIDETCVKIRAMWACWFICIERSIATVTPLTSA